MRPKSDLPLPRLVSILKQVRRSTRTGIGGWLPVLNQQGVLDPYCSPWYSREITSQAWLWVFEMGGRPALVISTLESKLWPEVPPTHKSKVLVVPTWTENRGNGAALNRLMSTRFPSSAVLTELASYMKRMIMEAQMEWSPRSGNSEADELVNGNFHASNPALRVSVDHETLNWTSFHVLSRWGDNLNGMYRRSSPWVPCRTEGSSSGKGRSKSVFG